MFICFMILLPVRPMQSHYNTNINGFPGTGVYIFQDAIRQRILYCPVL
jgi:hypothetical protein